MVGIGCVGFAIRCPCVLWLAANAPCTLARLALRACSELLIALWCLCVVSGLRFFEETEDNRGGCSPTTSTRPCLSAVGTVDAPCEAVFRLVMDLSPASRYE